MKYMALMGLFIAVISGFLPFKIIAGGPQYISCWLLPLIGILLMFLLKKKSLDDTRGISGVIGIVTGVFATWSILETLSYPIAAGISVEKGIPVFLLGSILSCLGRLAQHIQKASFSYRFGVFLVLLGLIIGFILGYFASFFYAQILWSGLPMFEILSLPAIISLSMIFIGTIIVVIEFIKTIQSETEQISQNK